MEHQTEDRLDRGRFIEELGQLVRADGATSLPEAHGTILLDGKYGTGKTFALKLLEMNLSRTKTKVVYFDAWMHEDVADPIVTISAMISDAVKERWMGRKLLKASARLAVDVSDRYVPGTREIVAFACSREKNIRDFQAALEKLVASVEQLGTLTDGNAPLKLVVLVDELDRCRPDFALRVLERIKHFFSVRGIGFVVCMDTDSMREMVRHAYGISDADGYLLKFFDRRLALPEFDRKAFVSYLYREKHGKDDSGEFTSEEQAFVRMFAFVTHVHDTSLRQMIRGVRETPDPNRFVSRFVPNTKNNEMFLAVGLVMGLFAHDPNLADEAFRTRSPEFRGLECLLGNIGDRLEAISLEQKYVATHLLGVNHEGDPDWTAKHVFIRVLMEIPPCFGCGDFRVCVTKGSALSRLVDKHITPEDAERISAVNAGTAKRILTPSFPSHIRRIYAYLQARSTKPAGA